MARKVLVYSLLVAVGFRIADALSCYECTEAACLHSAESGAQKVCAGDNDSCYTKFSGYIPIQRGCLSEVSADVCGENDCESCQSDFCNVYSTKQHKCVSCSSVLEEPPSKCVSDPGGLAAEQCGAVSVDVTEAQCYSRVVGHVTERGCVQSQADLDGCHDGTLCSTCAGAGCNSAEYPAGRQKCVKCDSAPCNINTVTSYCDLPGDSCVTALKSGGTYLKNCEGSMSEADRQSCQTSPSSCVFCSKHECNKAQFNAQQVGRRCYTCQGTDCLRSSLMIESCHDVDDQCFTMFAGFNPVRRGCRAALTAQDKAICDDADDVACATCASDVCNLSGREDHQCAYCSSVLDGNCVTGAAIGGTPLTVVQCPAPSTEISADAQCYTRIVGGVTERGCLGSATDAEECRSPESCQLCAIENGVACNDKLFPADRRKCTVGSTPEQYCPDPWDDCVQILNGGTYTKKCQSSMSATEVSFCEANSNKCYSCASDNCNQENQAFDYVDCLSCDSHDDPACATNPSSITSIEECDSCVTLLSNDTNGAQRLQRTCLSYLPPEDAELCSAQGTGTGTDPDTMCESCSGNLCNTGVYPEDRLACYSCTGGSCFSHESIQLEYCPTYRPNDACIAQMDQSGKLVRMGCRSSLSSTEAASCATNPQLCRSCSTAGCNDPVKYWNSGSCVQCDSALDVGCVGRAADMDAEPCNDPLNRQCYTQLVDETNVRGCVNDLDSAAKTRCSQGVDCTTCEASTGKCNVNIYPVDRLACYTCLQPPCISQESMSLEVCPKYSTMDSCILLTDSAGQLVRLGCNSTLSVTEQSTCKTNPRLCRTCSTPGCNDPVKYGNGRSCVQCDSALDVGCVGRAADMDAEPCNDPLNSQCFTQLIDGTNVRGCVSDLDSAAKTRCNQGVNCTVCEASTGKCNVDIYPVDRLACYTCLQPPCISQESMPLEVCPKYSTTDSCVLLADTTGHPVRMGCNSTLSVTEQSACKTNPQLCRTCSTAKCNDPATVLGSGKCIKCSSAFESNCMTMSSSFESEPCNDPQNAQCYSRFINNQVTERGCLTDLDATSKAQCLQGDNCLLCSSRSDHCNSLEYPMGQIKCFQCDSTQTSAASCKNAQSGTPTHCQSFSTANQCYTVVKSNGETIRKCSTLPRDQECAGSARCEVCLFSGCNSKVSTAVMSTDGSRVNTTTEAPPKPCSASGRFLSLSLAVLVMIVFVA